MSRGPERKIENDFCEAMSHLGWINRKGDIAAEMQAGELDRFFYGHGARVRIVEFKREGAPRKRRGEKLQRHTAAQFRERGFPVYVVIGPGDARSVFKTITGEDFDEVLKLARVVRSGRKPDRNGRRRALPRAHSTRTR